MTDEEQQKLDKLMQYAQLGAVTPTPAPGWGSYVPTQPPAPTVASDTSTAAISPVVAT